MAECRERAIVFAPHEVRATLDGRKSQFRRSVIARGWTPNEHTEVKLLRHERQGLQAFFRSGNEWLGVPCPFGQPGDRLWVKETWGAVWPGDSPVPLRECRIEYRADEPPGSNEWPGGWPAEDARGNPDAPKWRPSIHMPRWMSRLLLEVTEARVERLQDITEQDILAEGVTIDRVAKWTGTPWSDMPTLHHAWRVLWDHINGERAPYTSDPWVWAITMAVKRRV